VKNQTAAFKDGERQFFLEIINGTLNNGIGRLTV
jgi:hypothetical protein